MKMIMNKITEKYTKGLHNTLLSVSVQWQRLIVLWQCSLIY